MDGGIKVTEAFGASAGKGDSSRISKVAENSNASSCNSRTPSPIPTQARGPAPNGMNAGFFVCARRTSNSFGRLPVTRIAVQMPRAHDERSAAAKSHAGEFDRSFCLTRQPIGRGIKPQRFVDRTRDWSWR